MIQTSIEICKEMLSQRGYTIILCDNTDELPFTAQNPDTDNVVHVTFILESKMNIRHTTDLITLLKNANLTHAIVIHNEGATPSTLKLINDSDSVDIELFHVNELQFNITKHELQPRFRKLNPEERVTIRNTIDVSKFPKITRVDAIRKFYNFTQGDLIEITTDDIIRYRIVS